MSDDYAMGNHEARIASLERRCDAKEAEIKALEAWKNRAVGYITILVFLANKIIDLLGVRL